MKQTVGGQGDLFGRLEIGRNTESLGKVDIDPFSVRLRGGLSERVDRMRRRYPHLSRNTIINDLVAAGFYALAESGLEFDG